MKYLFPTLLIVALFSACVPRNQFEAVEVEKNYYQNLVERNDSIQSSEALETYGSQNTAQRDLDLYIRQVENLTATNQSLNRSFQDLQNRYQTLLDQNDQLLNSSGQQVTSLQQSLADRAAELARREQELRQAEIELQNRASQQDRLVQEDPTAYQPASYSNTPVIDNSGQALKQNQLQSSLQEALSSFSQELHYIRAIGTDELVLTVAEVQLFSDGYQLSAQGQEFLLAIAGVFYYNSIQNIDVVGHEDPQVDELSAFENSTDRAIAISRYLLQHGLNGRNVTAGGQGATHPRVASDSPTNRAINRRTDIIISLEQ